MIKIPTVRFVALILALSGCAHEQLDATADPFFRDALAEDDTFPPQITPVLAEHSGGPGGASSGVRGLSPTAGLPSGWGGGVHTFDAYAEGTVGVGTGGGVNKKATSKSVPKQGVASATKKTKLAETTADLNDRSLSAATQLAQPSHGVQSIKKDGPIIAVKATTLPGTPGHTVVAAVNLPVSQEIPLPQEQWTLWAGGMIREQVIAWGKRAGWTVSWPLSLNWPLPATAFFTGNFADKDSGPIEQVVDALASDGRLLKVNFRPSSHMLIVTGVSK